MINKKLLVLLIIMPLVFSGCLCPFDDGDDEMATFGKPAPPGGSTQFMNTNDVKEATRYQITQNGTLSKIYVYLRADTSVTVRAGIYNDTGAGVDPTTLVGQSTNTLAVTSADWYEFDFSGEVLVANNWYWLTFQWTDAGVGDNLYYYYDVGTSGHESFRGDVYADGLSDPWGTPSSFSNDDISIDIMLNNLLYLF